MYAIAKEASLSFGKGKNLVYDKKISVSHIVDYSIQKNSSRVAVRFADRSLTYKQLGEQIDKLANYLIKCGIKNSSRVAVYLDLNLDTIISILAILKIGACYVPLDVTYPIERLNYMLIDSRVSMLLTHSTLVGKLQADNLVELAIDSFFKKNLKKAKSCCVKATGQDLAYIIYTSGSTGKPKGVEVQHFALHNHMLWMKNFFAFSKKDTVLLKTPLSFDPSIWEIFLSFYIEGALVVATEGAHLDPQILFNLIRQFDISVLQLVPSTLRQFLNLEDVHKCISLKHLFCGGESLLPNVKRLFFKKLKFCTLYNLYGPAEATIDITSYTVRNTKFDIDKNIIGAPIYNTRLYVVNSDGNLANVDEKGELYIGSNSLAKGYCGSAEMTEEKFIKNPFDDSHDRVYKTGDFVKWTKDGVLEYLGRDCDQVKINGARVELAEIIFNILKHKAVENCVVLKKSTPLENDYLVCYIVQKPKVLLNIKLIKDHLKKLFPSYMVPKAFMALPKFPLNSNGKVDLKKLPDISAAISSHPQIEKLTSTEEKLLLIWKDILKIPGISKKDNFFDVGGNSFATLKLITCIKEKFSLLVRIGEIFLYPTIKAQAALLDRIIRKQLNELQVVISLQSKGKKTPIFLIHPIGGTVFWYSILSKIIGEERPVYGIQDPGIDLEKVVFDSIEEMARFYIREIKKIQPVGPYLVGGASFGATVAVEIAKILSQLGERVAAVFAFDGWGVYPNMLRNKNYFKRTMQRQHEELLRQFKSYDLKDTKKMLDIQWDRLNLLWSYHLDEVPCLLILFKAKELLPAFCEIDSYMNHWERYKVKEIWHFIVPGNHETMFQQPYVQELATKVRECLRKLGL